MDRTSFTESKPCWQTQLKEFTGAFEKMILSQLNVQWRNNDPNPNPRLKVFHHSSVLTILVYGHDQFLITVY